MAFSIGVGPTENFGDGDSHTSWSVVLNGTTAGRSLVVGALWVVDSASVTSVTCTGESNLTLHSKSNLSNRAVQLFTLSNITTGGNKTITVNWDGGVFPETVFAVEVIGGSLLNVVDVQNVANANSTNPTVGLTTTKDNDAIFAAVIGDATPTEGSGYTAIPLTTGFALPVRGEYDLDVGAAGAKTADFTASSGEWAIAAVALKEPGNDGAVSFEEMTALGNGPPFGNVAFEPMYAFDEPNGLASFLPMTASGKTFVSGAVAFEAMTATGIGVGGATGAVAFAEMSATGVAPEKPVASGAAVFLPMVALGVNNPEGAAAFKAMTAAGVGRSFNAGAASFQPMVVLHRSGAIRFEPLQAYGIASAALQNTFTTKVMNTRTTAVSEFTGWQFNSFARIGKDFYGAGPGGLTRLDGAPDTAWSLRTGRMDDKVPFIKRVPQIFLGLRSNGVVTVRVWSADNTYHDYKLPKVQIDTIHQHRVVPGKGLRARWFAVELRGAAGTTLELDSMQVDFKHLDTRLG